MNLFLFLDYTVDNDAWQSVRRDKIHVPTIRTSYIWQVSGNLSALRMIERLEAVGMASGDESRQRNGRGVEGEEMAERNVEIKVFASYSNVTWGARGMNRMSFVGLKRVGGGEIYIKKDDQGRTERKL